MELDLGGLLLRLLPIVVFLLTITVAAEIAERAGVFDVAGHWVAHVGGGRVWLLWLLYAGLAVLCTIFLSLDTTAVLLTPVGLAVARQINAPAMPFALTTLWLANTASLMLPVSNLTNLLALHSLRDLGVGHAAYLRLMWWPALAAIVVTVGLIFALQARKLLRSYVVDPPAAPHDRVLLRVAGLTCVVIGPCFALGLPPWGVASAAALVLVVACRMRSRETLRGLPVPWLMAAGFVAMAVVVAALQSAGLSEWLRDVGGTGGSTGDLLRLAGSSAALANGVNNLPAYLALEPLAADSPARLAAILIGVNAGPLVTPWASLATLLWLQRCRSAGLRVPLVRLGLAGLLCAVLTVGASVLALAASG